MCALGKKNEMAVIDGELQAGRKILQDNKADQGVAVLWLATTNNRKYIP